jgi:hypothetical protein
MANERDVERAADENVTDDDEERNSSGSTELTTADLAGTSGGTPSHEGATNIGSEPTDGGQDLPPLLPPDEIEAARTTWAAVQADFVDEPRRSVKEADQLVARLMHQLAEGFSQERNTLESQWDKGDEVSTEDLRLALQRYRAFFQRLLAA